MLSESRESSRIHDQRGGQQYVPSAASKPCCYMAKALMRVEQFLSVEQIEAHMQMIERADSCKTMILPCVRQCLPRRKSFQEIAPKATRITHAWIRSGRCRHWCEIGGTFGHHALSTKEEKCL